MMKMMNIIASIVSMIILVSCSGGRAASETTTTLEFWHGFQLGKTHEGMNSVMEYFAKENPDIKVKQVLVPWGEIEKKALTATIAGSPPDVFRGWDRTLSLWGVRGLLLDIKPFIDQDPDFDFNDFYDGAQLVLQQRNKIYGVSPSITLRMQFYNKKLWQQVGYEELPTDLDDFIEAAKRLLRQDDEGNVTQVGMLPWYMYAELSSWLYAIYGDFPWDIKEGKINDNPSIRANLVKILEWCKQISEEVGPQITQSLWYIAGDSGETLHRKSPQGPFFTGKIATVGQGQFFISNIDDFAPNDFTFGFSGYPGKANPGVTFVETNVYLAPYNVKYPEKTYRLLKFLSSPYFMNHFVVLDTAIPARRSIAESSEFQTNAPWLEAILSFLTNTMPVLHSFPAQEEFGESLARGVQEMFSGNMSAAEVVDRSFSKWKEEYNRVTQE